MKLNKTLTIIAIAFLIVNLFFIKNSESLNGGRAMIYIIILPLFWGATLITVGILTYKNRNEWFSNQMKLSTIVLLILCTPLSVWGLTYFTTSELELDGSSHTPMNGNNIKSETWRYRYSRQIAVRKFWKNGDRDSIWVYFDKEGDTLRVEKYEKDQLIENLETKK